MRLTKLLTEVSALDRIEKLRLIEILSQQLVAEEMGAVWEMTHDDFGSATSMSELLEDQRESLPMPTTPVPETPMPTEPVPEAPLPETVKEEQQEPAYVGSWVNAIRDGNRAAVEEALAQGVEVNALTDGQSPLHVAIEHQRVEIVRRLIAAGAAVNQDQGDGWTPLVHAIDIESDAAWQAHQEIRHESTELTEVLLESGAVPTALAFELAENYGNFKILELLRRFASK